MNLKVVLAGLAGGVAMFLLGWLFYGFLLMDLMKSLSNPIAGCERETMLMAPLITGNFVWGFFLAILFYRWIGTSTWKGGAVAGAFVGFMVAMAYDLMIFAGMASWTLNAVLLDIGVSTVMTALVGAVVGFVLGTGKK